MAISKEAALALPERSRFSIDVVRIDGSADTLVFRTNAKIIEQESFNHLSSTKPIQSLVIFMSQLCLTHDFKQVEAICEETDIMSAWMPAYTQARTGSATAEKKASA